MSELSLSLVEWALGRRYAQYIAVTSTTILLCDYWDTLFTEITLIWPSKWRVSNFLFMVTRYIVFAEVPLRFAMVGLIPNLLDCKKLMIAINVLLVAGVILCEGTLLWCLCALFDASRRTKIISLAILVSFSIVGLTVMGLGLSHVQFVGPSNARLRTGCMVVKPGVYFFTINCSLLLLAELVFLGFSIYHGVETWDPKNSGSLRSTVITDGVIYYLVLSSK
ncbi:hypothetical protein FA15DRAFT_221578 [Coprinopsis marcescibilis]|uniref:DUF6533 domain-containing protein n=1 Tax=Coprinopsis marcescibilis TaxID=230819 RepID=A0A5C3KH73_COPMA|nr:hypothetical protein FA15DRAFT_221578 [Coprinopsis marcescibilis]